MSTLLHDSYEGKRILVTGHTGFKGSWLVKYLELLGAQVTGLSLDPEPKSLFTLADFVPKFGDTRLDLRNHKQVSDFLSNQKFDLVFHLAAQPLVSRAYQDPIHTAEVNIIATGHLIIECSKLDSCLGIVVATTDKVYKPNLLSEGHRENDALGGIDPYSASKSAAEALIVGLRNAINNDNFQIASVRAGNVIGGGDFAENRLIPDLIRAFVLSSSLDIRNPDFVRPWTHVLDILSGYISVGQKILTRSLSNTAYNFGPDGSQIISVAEVIEIASKYWGSKPNMNYAPSKMKEDSFLTLNSDLAKKDLGWSAKYDIDMAIKKTMIWWMNYEEKVSASQLVADEILEFLQYE